MDFRETFIDSQAMCQQEEPQFAGFAAAAGAITKVGG